MARLIDAIIGQSRDKAPKQSVLYIHRPNTDYECRDCPLFYRKSLRCAIHKGSEIIAPNGSCGFYIKGRPSDTGPSKGRVDKTESGYTEAPDGFSCKRCRYFDPANKVCSKVNEFSEGDDFGLIHPDACCNAWEPLE